MVIFAERTCSSWTSSSLFKYEQMTFPSFYYYILRRVNSESTLIINNRVRIGNHTETKCRANFFVVAVCHWQAKINDWQAHRQHNLSFQVKNFPRESRAPLRIRLSIHAQSTDGIRLWCYGTGSGLKAILLMMKCIGGIVERPVQLHQIKQSRWLGISEYQNMSEWRKREIKTQIRALLVTTLSARTTGYGDIVFYFLRAAADVLLVSPTAQRDYFQLTFFVSVESCVVSVLCIRLGIK